MPNIRSRIRFWSGIILAAIVFPIIVGVVGEFFIESAREQGIYDNPTEKIGGVVTAFHAFVTQTWFLLLGAFAGGLTAGLWVDVLLRRSEKEGRLKRKEDRVGREQEQRDRRNKAAQQLDDLFAEGVSERNRLKPVLADFDRAEERAGLVAWSERVVDQLKNADVKIGQRTRFRTLNTFVPSFEARPDKSMDQCKLESMWNEKLRRLQEIMDGFN